MRALTTSTVAAHWYPCGLGLCKTYVQIKILKTTKRGREKEGHSMAMEYCQYLVNPLNKF